MERREVVRWVIDRVVEILADADAYRTGRDSAVGERLANIAGSMLAAMYDPFALEDEFVSTLEGIRGAVEATQSWTLSGEITRLHEAYYKWARLQGPSSG